MIRREDTSLAWSGQLHGPRRDSLRNKRNAVAREPHHKIRLDQWVGLKTHYRIRIRRNWTAYVVHRPARKPNRVLLRGQLFKRHPSSAYECLILRKSPIPTPEQRTLKSMGTLTLLES